MFMGIIRLKIGVVGLSPGAGAGFIAVNLARSFVKKKGCRPALLELGGGRLYDSLAMDKHFAGKEYHDFFCSLSDNRNFRGICNELHGVNWVLNSPNNGKKELDLIRLIRLVNNVSGNIIVCKISNLENEDLWELMWDMDRVLVVIDPLPSMMLAGHEFLCKLRTSNLPMTYVVNKMNAGVSRRELLGYLGIKQMHYIPMVEPSLIYGAEYSCRSWLDVDGIRKVIEKPIEKIAEGILS